MSTLQALPYDILSYLPPLLSETDIVHLMFTSLHFYSTCCRHLYASITVESHAFDSSSATPQDKSWHEKLMIALTSDRGEKNSNMPLPARYILHLAVHWPMFADDEAGKKLMTILLHTTSLRSLNLTGKPPPTWTMVPPIEGPLHSTEQFLPHLAALKTASIQDALDLAGGRPLESLFVGREWGDTAQEDSPTVKLLRDLGEYSFDSLRHLQLDVVDETITDIVHELRKFNKLDVLSLSITLNIPPEGTAADLNPMAVINECVDMVKCWPTHHSHPLRTFALFVLPEPRGQESRETCAALIRETLRHCDTLRQVELQWRRWSIDAGGTSVEMKKLKNVSQTIRNSWAFVAPPSSVPRMCQAVSKSIPMRTFPPSQ